MEEADGPRTPCAKEQGTAFMHNVAIMRDTIQADVVPPSLQAEPLSAVPRAELQRVEVPFSPYVTKRLAELSADLQGEVDGHDTTLSGEQGLQKGKWFPKPKAKLDVYRVGREVFSFVPTSLEAHEVKEQDSFCVSGEHPETGARCSRDDDDDRVFLRLFGRHFHVPP